MEVPPKFEEMSPIGRVPVCLAAICKAVNRHTAENLPWVSGVAAFHWLQGYPVPLTTSWFHVHWVVGREALKSRWGEDAPAMTTEKRRRLGWEVFTKAEALKADSALKH